MTRAFFVATVALFAPSMIVLDGNSANAAVPSTVCHLERQVRINPSSFVASVSTPTETYRFKNGKLFITSPGRPEHFYNDVREVEFGKRYVSGHKIFVFTVEGAGKQRVLMFHSDQSDIRVGEFACGP